ncbi:glycosyltransferase [Piscinibacter sp. XHJ-5]|uniref:glycosyltransferase n=1 Tax=Piscinibacter sp. XHJ-5 TaxID=3037797 RepID=UPI0024529094|nr:glycosyltransferase [Piscinibacter sp. XHJ-5]
MSRVSALGRQVGWILSRRLRRVKRCAELPPQANFVVVYVEHELSNTQVYPFHLYADDIAQRHGARLFEIALQDFEADADRTICPQVRWVAFQTGFDLSDGQMQTLLGRLREVFPEAALTYLDFFAPLDLRYAAVLDPWVDCYVKKQVFTDFSQYGRTTVGDTNLTDHFARRYGIDKPQFRFEVPQGFGDKVVIGSNFCVSPRMIDRFRGRLPRTDRPIDVHARIATRGVDWYQRMRQEARQAALAVQGVRTVSEGRVSQSRFYDELAASKVCFSPFGYGEVCWRDYEAIACGALLIKPRMDHVRLAPEVFVPGETYIPIEWDCSDYEDRLREILADDKRRREICAQAFEAVHRYIEADAALDDLAPVFEAAGEARR